MTEFQWLTEGSVARPVLNYEKLEKWLVQVAKNHGKSVGDLNYIFCDDETILKVNRLYLKHDYYTDIITFDRSKKLTVQGDMYISLHTIASNAREMNLDFFTELNRVIVHGLLHLCGIDDKGPGEREIMEKEENTALELLDKMD